jgi:peptidoglycan/LPS O-acetylase OafA/YrhL
MPEVAVIDRQTEPPSLLRSSTRIPYLDGLRAYSVFAVLMAHSGGRMHWIGQTWAFPLRLFFCCAGFGVKVFFVLSGFLITTLLLNELEARGRISIAGFYARRVARIFPAFYAYFFFILLVVVLGCHVVIDPGSILAAATYTWNYGFLWTHPTAAAGGTFGHLWTLALEEQFYLFWPACLVLLGARKARKLAVSALFLLPLLRLVTDLLWPHLRGYDVIMFQSGADPILWGVAAAFAARGPLFDWVRSSRFRRVIPWVCGAVVYGLSPWIGSISKGASSIVGIGLECGSVALFLLWLLTGEGGWLRRVLEWPWMVQLGLLSYSLYIWQQLFLLWDGFPQVPLLVRWAALGCAAVGCYYGVEVPLRRQIRVWFRQTLPAGTLPAGN